MYYALGASVSPLHRESTDSLIDVHLCIPSFALFVALLIVLHNLLPIYSKK